MSHINAQQRVRQARMELELAQTKLSAHWQPWYVRLARCRLALLLGGGLLAGYAIATVPPRHWSRVGAALLGSSAWLARSAFGPALIGALLAYLPMASRTTKLDADD